MNINKKNPFSLNVKYFTDDRGVLSFCNEFNLSKFKRFYVIKNFHTNFIRAWHAHKKEDKAFMITKGSFQVSAVKIDNWKNPSKSSKVHNFIFQSVIIKSFLCLGFCKRFKVFGAKIFFNCFFKLYFR